MAPRQNNISYEGGSLPPFLARLHAQVKGSGSGSTFTSSAADTPHFDPHLEARRAAKRTEVEERRKKRKEKGGAGLDGDEEDEDDEFGGAQVVVLDEATDLSREQALHPSQSESDKDPGQDPARSTPLVSKSDSIATPGLKRKAEDPGGPAKKPASKDGDTGLSALADEIAKQKRPKTEGGSALVRSKADLKEKERKERNKRAAKEKKKTGKGLSFDI